MPADVLTAPPPERAGGQAQHIERLVPKFRSTEPASVPNHGRELVIRLRRDDRHRPYRTAGRSHRLKPACGPLEFADRIEIKRVWTPDDDVLDARFDKSLKVAGLFGDIQ